MNRKLPALIITFSHILLLQFSAIGQGNFRDGFVITNDGDTISGQIKYYQGSSSPKSCEFKNEGNETTYFANDLIGYGYEGDKFYTTQVIPMEFVEVLVRGHLDLYKHEHSFYLKKEGHDLQKLEQITEEKYVDGKKVIVEDRKWLGVLRFYMQECPAVSQKVTKNLIMDERHLATLVIKYNQCISPDFTVYKESKPWTKFKYGIEGGVNYSAIDFSSVSVPIRYLQTTYSTYAPRGGLLLSISSPRVIENLALDAGISFSRYEFSGFAAYENPSTQDYHDTFLEMSTLSIPIGIKYSIIKGGNSFNLGGGMVYDHNFNTDVRLYTELVSNSIVTTLDVQSPFSIKQNRIGYWVGLGHSLILEKTELGIFTRYSWLSQLIEPADYFAINNRISISLYVLRK